MTKYCSILQQYLDFHEKYTNIYGDKTIVLMMVGGAASDLFDGLFDIQIGDTDLSFKALTFQGLSAF